MFRLALVALVIIFLGANSMMPTRLPFASQQVNGGGKLRILSGFGVERGMTSEVRPLEAVAEPPAALVHDPSIIRPMHRLTAPVRIIPEAPADRSDAEADIY